MSVPLIENHNFSAIVGSAGLPLMCILFGEVLQAFVDFDTYGKCSITSSDPGNITSGLSSNVTSGSVEQEVRDNLQTAVNRFGWGMCAIGFASWLGQLIQNFYITYLYNSCLGIHFHIWLDPHLILHHTVSAKKSDHPPKKIG